MNSDLLRKKDQKIYEKKVVDDFRLEICWVWYAYSQQRDNGYESRTNELVAQFQREIGKNSIVEDELIVVFDEMIADFDKKMDERFVEKSR
jgi:hypothetical protein